MKDDSMRALVGAAAMLAFLGVGCATPPLVDDDIKMAPTGDSNTVENVVPDDDSLIEGTLDAVGAPIVDDPAMLAPDLDGDGIGTPLPDEDEDLGVIPDDADEDIGGDENLNEFGAPPGVELVDDPAMLE